MISQFLMAMGIYMNALLNCLVPNFKQKKDFESLRLESYRYADDVDIITATITFRRHSPQVGDNLIFLILSCFLSVNY